MTFQKMSKKTYPIRLWALVGRPNSGKSTFATQMRGPLLVVDADHRFDEVLDLAAGDVLELSNSPADNVDADRITRLLAENMPGTKVNTICVDSLTAILVPLIIAAMQDKETGRVKNLAAAFRTKAICMRQIQDGVSRWGTDVLWVYHLHDSRDAQGKELTKATISATELARLTRSINMQLEVILDKAGKRGIRIVWARCGRAYPEVPVLWDDSGTWANMPERIEAAVYDGLSKADQAEIEQRTSGAFPTPAAAIDWGLTQGAFKALQHAKHAYEKLKADRQPKDADEMADLWRADVARRLAEAAA